MLSTVKQEVSNNIPLHYQQRLFGIMTILTVAIFLLVSTLLTPGITSVGQGSSHCMVDCNMGQHGPSLYEQYCCQIGNYGKTLRLEEKGRKNIILCPPTRPKSCPGNLNYIVS